MLLVLLGCTTSFAVPCALNVFTDYFPEETSLHVYKVDDPENTQIINDYYWGDGELLFYVDEGDLTNFASLYQWELDLSDGNYVLTIHDDYGDGMNFGNNGYVEMRDEDDNLLTDLYGNEVQVTGDFGQWKNLAFTLLPLMPPCIEPNTSVVRTTVQSGNASNPATWGGTLPQDGDQVVINHDLDWDIDCLGANIVLYKVTVNAPLITSQAIRTKTLQDDFGINVTNIRLNGCNHVRTSGSAISEIDELVVESGDSVFFDQGNFSTVILEQSLYADVTNMGLTGNMNVPPVFYFPPTSVPEIVGTVERKETFQIPTNGRWRFPSITGMTTTFGEWDSYNVTSGFDDADYDYSEYPWVSVLMYDETNLVAHIDSGLIAPPLGDATVLDEGVMAYFNGGTYTTVYETEVITSDVTFNVSYTPAGGPIFDGWGLEKNPFTSSINLMALQMGPNMLNMVYSLNTVTKAYEWRALNTNTGTLPAIFPSGQAFWVHALNAASTVTIPVDAMVSPLDEPNVEYRDEETLSTIKVNVSNGDMSQQYGETYIYSSIEFDASIGYDPAFDVISFNTKGSESGNLFLFSVVDGILPSDARFDQQAIAHGESFEIVFSASTPTQQAAHWISLSEIVGVFEEYCFSVDFLEDDLGWIPISYGEEILVPENAIGEMPTEFFILRGIHQTEPTLAATFAVEDVSLWEAFDETNTVTFTNQSTGAISYSWDFGDGTVIETTDPVVVHAYEHPSTYTVTLTALSCLASEDVMEMDVSIECTPLSASVVYDDWTIDLAPGQSIPAIVFEAQGEGVESFIWTLGDGTVLYEQSPTYSYAATGSYEVMMVYANQCEFGMITNTLVIQEVTGIEDDLSAHWNVFVSENTIHITGDAVPEEVIVYDYLGQVVARSQHTMLLEASVTPGIYLISLQSAGKRETKRLLLK